VVFTVRTSGGNLRIVGESLVTGDRRILVQEGTYARYVPTGHLLYAWARRLLAVPFDLAGLEVTSDPFPIVEGINVSPMGAAQVSFSSLGWLVYLPSAVAGAARKLVWVIRKEPPSHWRPRHVVIWIPDSRQMVSALQFRIEGAKNDVGSMTCLVTSLTRLSFEADNFFPIWTADGKRVTFQSTKAGAEAEGLFWKSADGSETEELLVTSEHTLRPESWSRDNVLAFVDIDPITGWDIWVLPREGERKPLPYLRTAFDEVTPTFAPNGRWLVYASNESGRFEIYAQPFPGPGAKWQVSTEGGVEPVWARSGRELFYRTGDKMMALAVATSGQFAAGRPRVLFEEHYWRRDTPNRITYDVTPDWHSSERNVQLARRGTSGRPLRRLDSSILV